MAENKQQNNHPNRPQGPGRPGGGRGPGGRNLFVEKPNL
jgi:hypothetical protein